MAFKILTGPYLNHLTRTATAPSMDPVALSLFPALNLYDNRSSKPAIYSVAQNDSTIRFDLDIVTGGSFESTGDVDAWSVLGVGTLTAGGGGPGAYEGAGTMTVTPDFGGSAIEAIAYEDVTVRSGEELTFTAAAASGATSGTAIVKVRNRQTGKWLRGSDMTWTSSESTILSTTATSEFDFESVLFSVESLDTCITDTVTLRIYLTTTGTEGYFDAVHLWPSINWVSIHGHNIPPFITPTIEYSTDLGNNWTSYAAMTLRRDSFYNIFSSMETYRDWRVRLAGEPDTGSLMYIGELVAGQYEELLHNPKYGGTLKWVDLQTRLESDIREEFVLLHNQGPQRTMQLNFIFPSSTEYEQFHKQLYRGSRGGGNLICMAPTEMDDSVVILGRVRDTIEVAINTPLERTSLIEIVESPLPNAPEVAHAYDAPITGGEGG